MLYFRALTRGIAPLPKRTPICARRSTPRARQSGWPACTLNSRPGILAAARIRPADGQRIQRALEVLELTGERLSELQQRAEPLRSGWRRSR